MEVRSTRDKRRQERRAELLDAAIEAIRTVGPDATMEQLARAGGVTKPILYRHFRDRDGLITAVAERFADGLMITIQAPLLDRTNDPRHLLDSTVESYLRFIEEDPNLYRFLVHQAYTRGNGVSSINALVDNIAKQVAVVIGEQLREVGRDSGAAVPWAYGIVGMVHSAGDWWLDDQTMGRDTLVDYLTNLLWNGLVVPTSVALDTGP